MSFAPDQNRLSQAPPPWGVQATVAWLLLAFLISVLVATAVYAAWQTSNPVPQPETYNGVLIALGALASVPVQVAVLAVAAQVRRWKPLDYLALNMPKRGEIILAVICIVILDLVSDGILYVAGRDLVPPFQVEAYQSAKDAGWLVAMTVAIVLVAPIGEEVAFRGFLYRGLARPGWEIPAIGIIALAWALLHIQYDWLGMLQVFIIGLVLGWFRWASGSTSLTILMHVLVNAEAMLETVIKVELMS
jgi:membrane protease YdiL (CAAX protease family)